MNQLPQNLKLIRKTVWKLSQDRFANLVSSTRSKINSYENGGVEPSISFILRLKSLTSLPVEDLFFKELNIDQVPPFPLKDGKFYIHESNGKDISSMSIEELLRLKKNTQDQLIRIERRINEMLDT